MRGLVVEHMVCPCCAQLHRREHLSWCLVPIEKPTNEQRRVAEVGQLLAQRDAAVAEVYELREQLDKYVVLIAYACSELGPVHAGMDAVQAYQRVENTKHMLSKRVCHGKLPHNG